MNGNVISVGKHRHKKCGKDVISVNIVAIVLVGFFALLCLIPFYLIIVASFTDETYLIRNGYPIFPQLQSLSTAAYQLCLKNPVTLVRAYGVTIATTVIGTFLSVFLSTMTGYVLSRQDFPWREKVSFYFFFTTLFNGGLVPWYLFITRYLGLKNNILALILPMLFSVWNMIIAKTFMKGIPASITESGTIDGATDFRIFFSLILPLSKPLLATLSLFSAIAYWNDWYNCMLFISNDKLFTLQYYLQRMLGSASAMRMVAEKSGMAMDSIPLSSMQMAMTVIATGPIILLYPFIQKYFVKGLTIGAVKG